MTKTQTPSLEPKKKGLVKTCLFFSGDDIALADRLSEITGETRSALLRDAIRRGLREIAVEREKAQTLSRLK